MAENFLFAAPSGETAAGPKGTRQGLAGCTTSCTSQLQPFLLDALHHHQLPPPLPPSTLLQHCQMAAAALNSCWTHTSCRDSCPGRYSCRPRNPGCSVPAMPALAARQKYGSHCCLPANERRDLPGDQRMRFEESGLLEGSCWVGQLCRRRWQPQVERASMYSSPIPVPDLRTRVCRALFHSLSDREHWIPAKDIRLHWHLNEVSGV